STASEYNPAITHAANKTNRKLLLGPLAMKLINTAPTKATRHGKASTRPTVFDAACCAFLEFTPVHIPTQPRVARSTTNMTRFPPSVRLHSFLSLCCHHHCGMHNEAQYKTMSQPIIATIGQPRHRHRASHWPRNISLIVNGVERRSSSAPWLRSSAKL